MRDPTHPPRITVTSLAALGLALSLCGAGCTEDEPPEDPVRAYLSDGWGITLTGFAGLDSSRFEILEDGAAVTHGEGTIHVEGLGAQALIVDEEVAPQRFGGLTTVIIAEPDDGDVLHVTFDPVISRLSFGGQMLEMGVDANPDGTFHVWRFLPDTGVEETLAMTDGVGSYQHVEANGGLEGDSPYMLLMAFALGQSPVFEARWLQHVRIDDVASPPVPCDIFRAFCECVACHAKDGVGCDACPTLDR